MRRGAACDSMPPRRGIDAAQFRRVRRFSEAAESDAAGGVPGREGPRGAVAAARGADRAALPERWHRAEALSTEHDAADPLPPALVWVFGPGWRKRCTTSLCYGASQAWTRARAGCRTRRRS